MTTFTTGAERQRGRIWSFVTYPLRLGPTQPTYTPTPFSRLAAVHACSSAGDALVTVALAGSVFASVSLHAARGRTAVGLLCTIVPFVVVGPFLGPVIDRVRGGRRVMVVLSALGRAGACLLMAAWIHSLLLFPAAFVSLICSKTYLVAKASLVPNVVDRNEQLVPANAKLAVGSSIVTSIAGVLGAGIYKLSGSAAVLYVDVALLSLCALIATRLPPGRAEPPTSDREKMAVASSGSSTASGLPPGGLALTAFLMASMRAVAGLMTALVIFAFRRHSAPLIWYGLVAVASVGGNLGGAALAPLVRRRVREERIVSAAAVTIGVVALAMTQFQALGRRPAALILAVSVGLGASVAKLAFDAVVQRDAPSGSRSRLFARFEALYQLAWVLAALIPVIIAMPLLTGFVLVAAMTLGSTAAFYAGLSRARRGRLPWWWPTRSVAGVPVTGAERPPVIAGPVGGGANRRAAGTPPRSDSDGPRPAPGDQPTSPWSGPSPAGG